MDLIIERRYAPISGVEMREDGGLISFRGHAAVFNSLTDLGPFREQVMPGAFKKTAREADVRFLYNHEADSVMARTTNGTLRLTEDDRGLVADADLDPSDWDVQRLAPKLRAGNVSQMSFSFRVVGTKGESWEDHPEDRGKPIRTLHELALFDVSPVTFPAYDATDASLRCGVDAVAERRNLNTTPPEVPTPSEERQEEPPSEAVEPAAESTTLPPSLALKLKRLAYLKTIIDK